jgi:hypothetical protein
MSGPTYAGPLLAHEVELDLSRNEGMRASTDLVGSVADANELTRRYPDTTDLRRRLADIHGVAADQVLVTAGGDDALFRCKAQLRRRHALRSRSVTRTLWVVGPALHRLPHVPIWAALERRARLWRLTRCQVRPRWFRRTRFEACRRGREVCRVPTPR